MIFKKCIFTILLECCQKVVKTVDRLKFCPHDMKSAVARHEHVPDIAELGSLLVIKNKIWNCPLLVVGLM